MPPRNRKQARHSEPSARRDSNSRSRATSSPLARPDASQQNRSAPKVRTTKIQRLKGNGTTGYRESPLATVEAAPGLTPTDVGNGPSDNTARSTTNKPVSSAPALIDTGTSLEELLRKRDIERKQILLDSKQVSLDRKLLSLDMEEIDTQLKKA
ncbi:MAG: hypothetical protein L6R36_006351 [Xanthoria steineri]|nr:MAG: hypothetical protein L6R36_006351 [Xanthoria steineri]